MNHRQTVGEHTFGVLQILACLLGTRRDLNALNLLLAALQHDATEAVLGDTPANAKWKYPYVEESLRRAEDVICDEYQLPRLDPSSLDGRLLKFADLLELAIFCTEEMKSGNAYTQRIAENALDAIKKRGLVDVTPEAYEMYLAATADFENWKREKET